MNGWFFDSGVIGATPGLFDSSEFMSHLSTREVVSTVAVPVVSIPSIDSCNL
jgi:hypothetical protein